MSFTNTIHIQSDKCPRYAHAVMVGDVEICMCESLDMAKVVARELMHNQPMCSTLTNAAKDSLTEDDD